VGWFTQEIAEREAFLPVAVLDRGWAAGLPDETNLKASDQPAADGSKRLEAGERGA
jgi:hypothetical protein